MHVRSRSHRSDMMLARFDGEVHDRGEYTVIRTNKNPTFFWGNFLVFPEPPRDEADKWLAIHDKEFPPHPGRATIFTWDHLDAALGEDASFLAKGFERDLGWSMVATRMIEGPKHDRSLEVRPLRSDADWQNAEPCLIAAFGKPSLPPEVQRDFVVRQLKRYRAMVDAKWGTWFGAFDGARVIGCCGLVRQGEMARFQLVGTDPAYGRRGVCSTMLHYAGSVGLAEGAKELLIVADGTYHAARVYQSVGFSVAERLCSLVKYPQKNADSTAPE